MTESAPYQRDDKLGASLERDAPPGQVNDPSYKTRGNEAVPVVDDDAPVDDPMKPGSADSDRQLGTFTLFCFLFYPLFIHGYCYYDLTTLIIEVVASNDVENVNNITYADDIPAAIQSETSETLLIRATS